jgi:hypothetical protein
MKSTNFSRESNHIKFEDLYEETLTVLLGEKEYIL